MREIDIDEELLDAGVDIEAMYLDEEALLEDDEISNVEEAFLKGYGSA